MRRIDEKKRAFVAFDVSQDARDEAVRVQQLIKSANPRTRVRWTKPELIHVTLHFLGDLDAQQLAAVTKLTEQVASEAAVFGYWLDEIDAFPNRAHPTVLIIRAVEKRRASYRIHEQLSAGLAALGILFDTKPWQPHITLGRNPSGKPLARILSASLGRVSWNVSRIELITSELTASGPVYTVEEECKLCPLSSVSK